MADGDEFTKADVTDRDIMSKFFDECCHIDSQAEIPTTELFDSFSAWFCEKINPWNGMSRKKFNSLVHPQFRKFKKGGRLLYLGVALKNPKTPKENGERMLVLIGGYPGSGKTSLARKEYPDCLHYETDHLFSDVAGRYRFDMQVWQQARDFVWSMADLALSRGEDVVVCDLFHKRDDIRKYQELAEYHAAALVVTFCSGKTRSVHHVPLTAVRQMKAEAD